MTKRQRIEGTLHRSLPATLTIRQAPEGQPEDGLLRLRLSVSSETPYLRSPFWDEPWIEVLGHQEGEVDLARLNDGGAVLGNHDRYTSHGNTPLAGIGATERAWLEDGKILVDLALSRREALADLRQDIADGLVRNVSIGYVINERVLTKANGDGQPNEYRVVSWTPFEVSLVDIPADASVGMGRSAGTQTPAAQYRVVDLPAEGFLNLQKGDRIMQQANATTAADPTAAAQPAAQVEAVRSAPAPQPAVPVGAIREAVRVAGFGADLALDMIERGLGIDQARSEIFAKMAEKANANPTRSGSADIIMLGDETETRRDLMANAILHRMNPAGTRLEDGAREYRHLSLLRFAEDCLVAKGQRVRGLSGSEIAARAMHTTSDLPAILANVLNKRLRQAYTENAPSYQRWARRAPNAPDFKSITVAQLSGAPDLIKVNEHGEIKYGKLSDGKETYSVLTYARKVAITRQVIVNDDLRAIDRLASGFGASANRLENRTAYAILTSNAAMSDGENLFSTAHANYTSSGTVISATSLGVARTLMRKQKGLQNEELNIAPRFLIVPPSIEQVAYQYTSAQYVPAKSSDVNEFRAGGRTELEPIVEAVLEGTSSTAWYLLADNGQVDTVEYCYLDGSEGAYLETGMDFDIDGMVMKARLDFAAKDIDHRGMYKNVGA